MTLVAVWLEDNTLWAVGDTQISAVAATLTDSGSKIFPLPISSSHFDLGQIHPQMRYATVGFAYSGAALPAIMTYAFASICLQNLTGFQSEAPKLRDCAEFVRRISEKFLQEITRTRRHNGVFNIVIFGWCPSEQKYCAFTIEPNRSPGDPISMALSGAPLSSEDLIVLGSREEDRKDFERRVAEIKRFGDRFQRTARAPKLALEEIVESKKISGVGGAIQIGYAVRETFVVAGQVEPVVPGQPQAFRSFLGLDLDELGSVGEFHIGLPLLA